MSKFYIKKQYKTTNSVIVPDFVDAEQAFHLASSPESDMGWIIIAPWTTNEETCFFHRTVGNTVYVHWVNRSNPNIHAIGTIVYYASTIDYLNYLLSRQNHQMYIYKTSDDNVVVLGWEFYVGGIYTTVPDMDTSLGLPNQTLLVNSTSWIHLIDGVYTILPARNNTHYYVGNVITDIAWVITEINLANVTHLSVKGEKWDKWDKGDQGDQWDVGITYRGAYDNGTTYAPRDVVLYEGQLYINILAGTGSNPSDALHWNLFLPKSDLSIGLKQDSFVDVTSSVFTLTSTPFDSSVVYVFIRQRKGIVGVDYTYDNLTNQVTLLPPAISVDPQTIEILYAITGVGGSGSGDHLVLWDVTDTNPWTLFDKILGQWDLTVTTFEATLWDVQILVSAPERTYTSTDSSVTITPSEFTDIDWLVHKNVDLSVAWGGGGWATSTTVNSLNFAFADELTITSTDTSVGVTTTQNVDGDISIDLSVPTPDTTINGLTFSLADTLTLASADSSVTITPTQDVAGNINIDLAAASGGSSVVTACKVTSNTIVMWATGQSLPRSQWYSTVPLWITSYALNFTWVDLINDQITVDSAWVYAVSINVEVDFPSGVTGARLSFDLFPAFSPNSSDFWPKLYYPSFDTAAWTGKWKQSYIVYMQINAATTFRLRYYSELIGSWSLSSDASMFVDLALTKVW